MRVATFRQSCCHESVRNTRGEDYERVDDPSSTTFVALLAENDLGQLVESGQLIPGIRDAELTLGMLAVLGGSTNARSISCTHVTRHRYTLRSRILLVPKTVHVKSSLQTRLVFYLFQNFFFFLYIYTNVYYFIDGKQSISLLLIFLYSRKRWRIN